MFDKEGILHLLELIEASLTTIELRCKDIVVVDDFLLSEHGMVLLDSVCMKIIAVGESVKNLDRDSRVIAIRKSLNMRQLPSVYEK